METPKNKIKKQYWFPGTGISVSWVKRRHAATICDLITLLAAGEPAYRKEMSNDCWYMSKQACTFSRRLLAVTEAINSSLKFGLRLWGHRVLSECCFLVLNVLLTVTVLFTLLGLSSLQTRASENNKTRMNFLL